MAFGKTTALPGVAGFDVVADSCSIGSDGEFDAVSTLAEGRKSAELALGAHSSFAWVAAAVGAVSVVSFSLPQEGINPNFSGLISM
jgi:hypothetical protein